MTSEEKNVRELETEYNEQITIRREKLKKLQEENKDPFDVYKVEVNNNSSEIINNFEKYEDQEVKIAGRLMARRLHGKAGFSEIQDRYGRIQLYITINDIGEEKLKEFKSVDLGDFVSITGKVFKTKTGQISIHVTDFTLVSKALRPLPEKWHGLKDPDTRYRQREVDLIMNEEVRDTFYKRTQIIRGIRRFLDNLGYIETETPILSPIAGGAAARPFITKSNALNIDMYLRIATELYLKRLIVGGFEKVYDMGKIFRNEGIDATHNPEFVTIELYQAYADYNDMMEIMENLMAELCIELYGTTKINYQGTELDFTVPWRRVTMVDIVKEHTGIDFDNVNSDEEAREIAKEKHLEFKKKLSECSKGDVLIAMFEEFAEQHLIQPTFVCDYPFENSPLTKKKRGKPEYTERFEGFVLSREVCNAYSELNDPIVQRERFMQQARERDLGDDEAYVLDEEFMYALEVGMPPTGGMGIGVDRIIMFLTNSYSIRDVILFPTMKPLS